jgi:hypothetical protein
MPQRYKRFKRLAQRGTPDRAGFLRRIVLIALLHFTWPVLVFYAALNLLAWKVQVMMLQPDLGYWLLGVAAIVFFKGLIEIAMAWYAFARVRQTPRVA